MMYGHVCSESSATVAYGISFEMHIRGLRLNPGLLFVGLQLIVLISANVTRKMDTPQQCCSPGYLFTEYLSCVNRTAFDESSVVAKKVAEPSFKCPHNDSLIIDKQYIIENNSSAVFNAAGSWCIANITNGSMVIVKCSEQHSSPILGLATIVFWGAQTYMPTNLAHMILCVVVILVYLSVPELGRGVYNRAVVRHNICHLMQGAILQLLGYWELNGTRVDDNLTILLWLTLQYFTIATVFWLNSICFDMTLAIMRFRWIAGSGYKNGEAEARKLRLYSIFAWGGPVLPTLLAGLCDFVPGVPKDFPLKPNYLNYRKGPSPIVNLYFFLVPAIVLLLNNVLFVCTTYRIIKIQRSTEIATRNQKNILKKKYFLFLRLYLLMGAPWFFGMLFACMNKLIFLKICRLVQPPLWLLMLTTHKDIVKKVKQAFLKCKHRRRDETSQPNTVCSNVP